MNDKEKAIAGTVVAALRSGYKITIERDAIGAVKHGTQIHITYIDELVKELGEINPWDYINEKLIERENT